jgi:hypothetical protein
MLAADLELYSSTIQGQEFAFRESEHFEIDFIALILTIDFPGGVARCKQFEYELVLGILKILGDIDSIFLIFKLVDLVDLYVAFCKSAGLVQTHDFQVASRYTFVWLDADYSMVFQTNYSKCVSYVEIYRKSWRNCPT